MKLSPPPTDRRRARGRAPAHSAVALCVALTAALVLAPAAHASAASPSAAARGGAQEVAPPQVQEAAPPKPKEAQARAEERAQSIIRGRVVYDDTNRPVRRAEVQVFDPNRRSNRSPRMAWTNGRGEFVVRGVPAGSYYVMVRAPGVVTDSFDGSADAKVQDATSATVDGTNSAEVRVRVKRGGAISGKVTYADGEPAAGAVLSLRRRKDGRLIPVYLHGGHSEGATMDDRGRYRAGALAPGEYVVGAAEQKTSVGEADADGGRRIYQSAISTTYYSGALSPQQATTVTVEAGREVEDIDITLIERSTHAVSGTVVERGTQRPVAGAEVLLRSRDEAAREPSAQPPTTQTDEQGRWWLEEVHEGGYALHVVPQYDYRPRGGEAAASVTARQKFVAKRQELQVVGGDMAGLVIEVSAGARVSGRVVVEGGKPLPPEISVYSEPAQRGESPVSIYPAQVGPDGTFAVENLSAGDYHFTVRTPREVTFYAKSVTAADGTDLLRGPLGVEEGATVSGVRIVLSPDVATLTGRVLSAQGATLRGAYVTLLPADPARRRLHTARLHASTSPDGSFRVSGAPGEYLVVILRTGQSAYEMGEAAVEARAASAPRVTLAPGESKRMDFTAPGDK